MTDIFLSYASTDRDRARAVAEALAEQGWSVWWDRTIPPGKQFDEVIEEALDSAKCVVVLWSSASVASQWVKTEAADAMRRKILVPAMIQDVKIPLEFRRLQAADLSRWPGERPDPELKEFFQSIAGCVGRPAQGDSVPTHATAPTPPSSRSRVETPPESERPLHRSPDPATRKVRPRGVALVVAGVAGIAAVAGAYGLYSAHSKHVAQQAEEDRRAVEAERRVAEEAHRNAEEQRREAEEATARAKTARDNAEREEAGRRKAEEDRRAAEGAATRAKAARDKAERDEGARRKAEEEGARRKAEEDAARLKAEQEAAARARAADETRAASAPHWVNLQWRDNALRFAGTLTWTSNNANLRAAAYDLRTGLLIGNYNVPARVSRLSASAVVVTAEFAVRGDSVSPYPHSHTAGLVLRAGQEGMVRLIQNCPNYPKPGECY